MSSFNPLETSSFLNKFEIQERIGTGSFGLVYKAKQKDRNQLLVIKQIPFSTKDNTTELQEARNEANILSKLNNRYVVKYHTSFEEGGYLYIIMEYCEGGDLSSYLSKMQKLVSHLTEIQIWKFFIQMSLGLAYIHHKKILHRDLKSLNIFLTKNLDVKIGDLGVAKILQNTIHAYTFIGTPYYLSPEILEEKPYNEKSDVWALGCILYEMATFKHPYNASNQAALFLKIKNGKYEPIGNWYSFELKKMIQILLDKNFHTRPDMKQVLEMQIFLDKAKYLGLYDVTIEMINTINCNNNSNNDNVSMSINSSNSKNYSGKKLIKSRQIKLIQIESNKKSNSKNISQVIKNDYNNYKNEIFKHNKKRKTSEDFKQNNNNNIHNNIHKRTRKAPSPSLIDLPSNFKKIKNTNIHIKSHSKKTPKPRINESYDNSRHPHGIIAKIKIDSNKHFHSFLKHNHPPSSHLKLNSKEPKQSNSHSRISSARNTNSEDHLKHYILHKQSPSNKQHHNEPKSTSTKHIRRSYNTNANIKGRICVSSSKDKQDHHSQINENCSSEMKRFIYELSQKIPTLDDNNRNRFANKKIKFKQQYPVVQTEMCLQSETFYVEEAEKEGECNGGDEGELFNYSGSEEEGGMEEKERKEEGSSEEDEEKVSIVKGKNEQEMFVKELQKEYNELKGKLMAYSDVINFEELMEIYGQIGNRNMNVEKMKNDIEQYIVEHIKDGDMARKYSKLFEKWISTEIKLKNCFDN